MLIFAIHRTIIKISGEKYLSTEVNTALNNVDEVIGKEKLTFTYIDSVPIYNANGTLEGGIITYKVVYNLGAVGRNLRTTFIIGAICQSGHAGTISIDFGNFVGIRAIIIRHKDNFTVLAMS